MITSKRLRNIVAAGLLVFFAASLVWANNSRTLTGRDLLKAKRRAKGAEDKASYTERQKQLAAEEPNEPNEPNSVVLGTPPQPQPVIKEALPGTVETEVEQPAEPAKAKPSKPVVGKAVSELRAETGADKLLQMIPAECLFAVRINNLDYTLSQLDQFLAGASPVPMATSMLVRMQLAGIFGNPQLPGLNTAGSFAVFGVAKPGFAAEPSSANIFLGILAPVTDYQQFISSNPNIASTEVDGVSKITANPAAPSNPLSGALITKVGNFALLASTDSPEALKEMAKSITAAKNPSLADTVYKADIALAAKNLIWAYGNVQQASIIFHPMLLGKIEQARQMMAQTQAAAQAAGQPQMQDPMAAMDMYAGLLETFMKEAKSVTLAVNPKPNAVNLTISVSAVPGSEMAALFTPDSTKKENKLLGYLHDDAMFNISGSITGKLNAKMMDFFAEMFSKTMAPEDVEKMKALAVDFAEAFSGNDAMSMLIDPAAKPPFVMTYVIEIDDEDKFNEIIDEAVELANTSGINDFYKQMGIDMRYTVQRGVGSYKGVSIDSAKLVMKSTMPNMPQGQMIENMYGEGLNYRWAMVDGLWVCAMGGDTNSSVRKLIDQAKAGGPKQISPETQTALALLSDVENADVVATLNILRAIKMGMSFAQSMGAPVPQIDIATKSNIALAAKFANSRAALEIAMPKEHLAELMQTFMMMKQPQMQPMMQVQQAKSFVIEPRVGIGDVKFGMPMEQVKEILGEPQRQTGKTYEYLDYGFAVMPARDGTAGAILCGDMDTPGSPLITNCKSKTTEGIGIGSTRQQIIDVYGQPSLERRIPGGKGKTDMLKYGKIHARFTLIDDKVVHMTFKK